MFTYFLRITAQDFSRNDLKLSSVTSSRRIDDSTYLLLSEDKLDLARVLGHCAASRIAEGVDLEKIREVKYYVSYNIECLTLEQRLSLYQAATHNNLFIYEQNNKMFICGKYRNDFAEMNCELNHEFRIALAEF